MLARVTFSLCPDIQKLRAMFWLRQHARFVFAENTIAIARHNLVDRIAKPSRQHTTGPCQTPDATELGQQIKDRI